jgi:hypothetical protein
MLFRESIWMYSNSVSLSFIFIFLFLTSIEKYKETLKVLSIQIYVCWKISIIKNGVLYNKKPLSELKPVRIFASLSLLNFSLSLTIFFMKKDIFFVVLSRKTVGKWMFEFEMNERESRWCHHSGWTFSWWWGELLIVCIRRTNNTK